MTINVKGYLIFIGSFLFVLSLIEFSIADTKSQTSTHWAFKPIRHISVPDHVTEDPIKWFVESKLNDKGLKYSTSAKRRDWVKRLYYNLIGLPPSFDELQGYIKDSRPDREVANLIVNNLLESPRYGEHWAQQ